MATLRILIPSILLMTLLRATFALEDPPLSKTSYKAIGEITTFEQEMGSTIQLAFEEHYNNDTGDAVFTVLETGNNISYVENGLTGQTLRYFNGTSCSEESPKDWTNVGTSLPGYEVKSGRIVFSLRQLLSISKTYLVDSDRAIETTVRGIPATSWLYKIEETTADSRAIVVTVTAYFSNPGWETTAIRDVRVPLGFVMKKTVLDQQGKEIDTVTVYVSVFAFLPGVVDRKAFMARENIYCEGRKHPLKFPIFPKWTALSFRSEYILPDTEEIKSMDVYYDTLNRLVRVDLDRLDAQDDVADVNLGRRYTSQITSSDLGVTFKFDVFQKKATCTIYPMKNYNFDPQEVVNPKLDPKKWSLDYILGGNTTDYVFAGKTQKRSMPCHLFQGIRKDWPDESGNVTSFWELCLSTDFPEEVNTVRFRDGELGILSAYVKVTDVRGSANDTYYKGFRMMHHFYDVIQEDPHRLSLTQFDVGRWCYGDSQKMGLQFLVNHILEKDDMHIIENSTSDTTFLRLWRTAIADATNILISYMRISQMQATIINDELFISFVLLGVHPDLPKEAQDGQPSLDEAYNALKDAIDGSQLNVTYTPSKKSQPIILSASPGSLSNILDAVIEGMTTPTSDQTTTTTSKPTLPIITILPTDDGRSSRRTVTTTTQTSPTGTDDTRRTTTSKPVDETKSTPMDGYGPGTVAGLSVGMLLIGITAGAGGTFYRFNGLPCLKR